MKNVGIIKENFDLAHKFTKLLNIKEMTQLSYLCITQFKLIVWFLVPQKKVRWADNKQL